MKRRIELNIGQGILCAIINSDESGLNQDDINALNAFYEKYKTVHVYMPESDSKTFRKCDISRLMDDCYTVTAEVE